MGFHNTSGIGIEAYKETIINYHKFVAGKILWTSHNQVVYRYIDEYTFQLTTDKVTNPVITQHSLKKLLKNDVKEGDKINIYTFTFNDQSLIHDICYMTTKYKTGVESILCIVEMWLREFIHKNIHVTRWLEVVGKKSKIYPNRFTHILNFERKIPDKDSYILNWEANFVDRRDMISHCIDWYIETNEIKL